MGKTSSANQTVQEISVCELNSTEFPTSLNGTISLSALTACIKSLRVVVYSDFEHTTVKNLWERP